MRSSTLATVVLMLHGAFVLFVVLGGSLVVRWPRVAWVHAPAAFWGALVEWTGWLCPLTPLEDRLRAGPAASLPQADFLERLLLPLLYPDWLTREIQIVLGVFVLAVNALFYWRAFRPSRPGAGPAQG